MGSPLSSSPVRGPASPTGFSSGPSWVACTPGPVLTLTAVDLNRTGPCPLCWTRCPRPSGRRRESQMEKPVEAQDLHSSTPRLGPGRAARTVAVPTWLCGRSARQHGPGDQERSVFESPHFWSLGLRSRLSEPCLGGWRRREKGLGAVCPCPRRPFPSPVRAQSWAQRAGPGGHVGRDPQGGCPGQHGVLARLEIPKRGFLGSIRPLGTGRPRGPTLQRKVCYTPPPHTFQCASLFLRGRGQGSAPVPPRENPRP